MSLIWIVSMYLSFYPLDFCILTCLNLHMDIIVRLPGRHKDCLTLVHYSSMRVYWTLPNNALEIVLEIIFSGGNSYLTCMSIRCIDIIISDWSLNHIAPIFFKLVICFNWSIYWNSSISCSVNQNFLGII